MHLRPPGTLGKIFGKLFDLLNKVLKWDHFSIFKFENEILARASYTDLFPSNRTSNSVRHIIITISIMSKVHVTDR